MTTATYHILRQVLGLANGGCTVGAARLGQRSVVFDAEVARLRTCAISLNVVAQAACLSWRNCSETKDKYIN